MERSDARTHTYMYININNDKVLSRVLEDDMSRYERHTSTHTHSTRCLAPHALTRFSCTHALTYSQTLTHGMYTHSKLTGIAYTHSQTHTPHSLHCRMHSYTNTLSFICVEAGNSNTPLLTDFLFHITS